MLARERRQSIVSVLQQRKSMTIAEISTMFNVSEETVRRDLVQLEIDNQIKRVLGGAFIGNVREALSFQLRREAKKEAKRHIAEIAAGFLKNGDTVFIDPSTTGLYIAENLHSFSNLTVITCSQAIANALCGDGNNHLIVAGGKLDSELMCYTGMNTVETLSGYHADVAFVSCTGVSLDNGLTDSDECEARIRSTMLKNANRRYLIADLAKFGKTTMYRIADIGAFDGVICEAPLDSKWAKEFRKLGVEFFS